VSRQVRGTVRQLNDTGKVARLRDQFPGIELREAGALVLWCFGVLVPWCF
jgi:hypothetical protein